MNKKEIDLLVKDLGCEDMIKCLVARKTLASAGEEAVPALVSAQQDKNSWVRWEAAKTLSQIGGPAVIQPLIKALEDKEFGVRWVAAEGLISLGDAAIAPVLRALISDPKSLLLRTGAHHVLQEIKKLGWQGILKPVVKAMESPAAAIQVHMAAQKALDEIMLQS